VPKHIAYLSLQGLRELEPGLLRELLPQVAALLGVRKVSEAGICGDTGQATARGRLPSVRQKCERRHETSYTALQTRKGMPAERPSHVFPEADEAALPSPLVAKMLLRSPALGPGACACASDPCRSEPVAEAAESAGVRGEERRRPPCPTPAAAAAARGRGALGAP